MNGIGEFRGATRLKVASIGIIRPNKLVDFATLPKVDNCRFDKTCLES
jgi:hypothetical protein